MAKISNHAAPHQKMI